MAAVEGRDRLVRAVDLAEVFARRRVGPLGILSPEAMELLGASPRRQSATTAARAPMTGVAAAATPTARGGGGGIRLRSRGARSGIRRGRNLYRSPARGRENATTVTGTASMGRGRSLLPSWYPRTPLRDITAITRAIERRRARLGEVEGLTTDNNQASVDGGVLSSSVSSVARLEHNISTPAPTTRMKPSPPSVLNVSKILLSATNQKVEGSEFLTPQRKLLNSIDTVEKAVLEELERLKRTPSAKKAERHQKVRTLMSMR